MCGLTCIFLMSGYVLRPIFLVLETGSEKEKLTLSCLIKNHFSHHTELIIIIGRLPEQTEK